MVLHPLPCEVGVTTHSRTIILNYTYRKDGAKLLVRRHVSRYLYHLTIRRDTTLGGMESTDMESMLQDNLQHIRNKHITEQIYDRILFTISALCSAVQQPYKDRHETRYGSSNAAPTFLPTWLIKLSNRPLSLPFTHWNSRNGDPPSVPR